MQKIIAALVGMYTRAKTKQWALRRGFELWLAELLAALAGSAASAAIMRA